MKSYKLNRTGEFTIRTHGPNHCGTTDVLTIRFRLTVRCTATSVDSRGFLFDQTRINDWFQAQRSTELSCERYAEHCARMLFKLIRAENPGLTPTMMDLALSPAPYAAEITFEWSAAPDASPTMAHVETRPVNWRAQNNTLDLFSTQGLFVQ